MLCAVPSVEWADRHSVRSLARGREGKGQGRNGATYNYNVREPSHRSTYWGGRMQALPWYRDGLASSWAYACVVLLWVCVKGQDQCAGVSVIASSIL